VVPPIKLQDQKGKIFDFASLRGQIIAVNFIYTRCPTVCGVTGLNYARLQNRIQESGYRDKVSLLSITLDPQYDTPPKLNQYLQRFTRTQDVSWRAARPLQLANGRRFLQELGVVSIPDGLGGFVHNAATHIVDQKGRLVRIISEDNLDKTLAAIKQLL
jgi:protein SCO1/2